jgi:hypothetical protein
MKRVTKKGPEEYKGAVCWRCGRGLYTKFIGHGGVTREEHERLCLERAKLHAELKRRRAA